MKKLWLTAVILAALIVTGLGAQEQRWHITRGADSPRARNNQITLLPGETEIYVHFRGGLPGGEFEKLILDFTISQPADVTWYAAFAPGVIWSRYQGGTSRPGNFVDYAQITSGPIETDFSNFVHTFYNFNPREHTYIIKSNLTQIFILVTVPRNARNVTFTMNRVEFTGIQN
jgi:hypothetical protein